MAIAPKNIAAKTPVAKPAPKSANPTTPTPTAEASLVVTSADLNKALETDLPVLLLIWNGDTLRADVKTELDRIAGDYKGRIRVIKADTGKAPEIAERFELGKNPLLLAWHNGEVLTRRNRPWGTDVQGVVEVLTPLIPVGAASVPQPAQKNVLEKFDTKPVIVTDDSFQSEVIDYSLPVLVDFWATWCEPCKQVAPILEKLAKEFSGKIRVAKVDVDQNPGLQQAFQIMSIPTLMFVKSGKIVGQQAGALPETVLRDAIRQLMALKV